MVELERGGLGLIRKAWPEETHSEHTDISCHLIGQKEEVTVFVSSLRDRMAWSPTNGTLERTYEAICSGLLLPQGDIGSAVHGPSSCSPWREHGWGGALAALPGDQHAVGSLCAHGLSL